MVITPTYSTSTGFMMAHFEAKKREKTIDSAETSAVKDQILVILRQSVTQKLQF